MSMDILKWAAQISIIVALALGACVFMLPNKTGPVAIILMTLATLLAGGNFIHADNGLTVTQAFLYSLLN